MFECPYCFVIFTQNHNLQYHLHQAKHKCTDKNIINDNNTKKYLCHFCQKSFTRFINLNKHKADAHGIAKLTETITEQIKDNIEQEINKKNQDIIDQLKLENKILQDKLSTQTTSPQTTSPQIINITNNGVIVDNSSINYIVNNYWKENISHITPDIWKECINKPYIGIPRLIKLIHFDPKFPENHNIVSKNSKLKEYSVIETEVNVYKENSLMSMLISDNSLRLENYAQEHSDIYDTTYREELDELLNKICSSTHDLSTKKNFSPKTKNMIDSIRNILRSSHGKIHIPPYIKSRKTIPKKLPQSTTQPIIDTSVKTI